MAIGAGRLGGVGGESEKVVFENSVGFSRLKMLHTQIRWYFKKTYSIQFAKGQLGKPRRNIHRLWRWVAHRRGCPANLGDRSFRSRSHAQLKKKTQLFR